jgi:hypothetical protein
MIKPSLYSNMHHVILKHRCGCTELNCIYCAKEELNARIKELKREKCSHCKGGTRNAKKRQ